MASSLETNKILAAVLTAGIIASGTGVVSRIIYHAETPEETAYVIEIAASGEGGEAEASATPLGVLLASADAAAGEASSRACAACHSFEEGGANKVGPTLHGVVGREIAAVGDFAYSDALAGMDGSWDYEALSGFLENPKGWAPGTKMSYAGIKSEQDRANMILYLRSISPDAPPLPEPEETEAADAAGGDAAGAEGGGLVQMVAAADPAAGEGVARACAACHSFDEGGANKIGPALHGVFGRDIASVADFAYSDALAGKEGAWDVESLAAFLADPKGWAPGTKMSYAGVKKEEDLAQLIAYMHAISPDAPPLPEGGQESGDASGAAADEEDQAAAEQDQGATGEQQAAAEQDQGAAGEQQAAAEQDQAATEEQQAAAEPAQPHDGQGQDQAANAQPAQGQQQAAATSDQAAEQQQGQAQPAGDQQATTNGQADQGMVTMVAAADPAAGETSFGRKCVACHSFEEGGPNKVGPNLHGVVGREIAALDGFKYSSALKDKDGAWDYAALDAFLADPRGWAKGTRMTFAGLKDDQERAEVISYLGSISPDAPAPAQ